MHEQPVPQPNHRVRNSLIAAAVIAAVLIVAVGTVIWLAREQQEGGAAALEATAADPATLPATAPFRIIANHIVVDAVLGAETASTPLIIDSGAPTMVSDDIAEAVGGEPAGAITTVAIDGSRVSNVVVPVSSVQIGDARFTDVGAIKGFLAPDNPLACISENGLIGASLMKEGVWQIDYDAGLITIAEDSSGLDHIDGAYELPFASETPMSPSPVVQLAVGDNQLDFILDTGSDAWLSVNPSDLEGSGIEVLAESPAITILGAGSAGTYEARIEYVAADVGVGGQQLEGVPLATISTLETGQGNIGNDFLSNFVLTIDWPAETIYLHPSDDQLRPTIPDSAAVSWDGEGIVVGSVVADMPGYGDRVAVGAGVQAIAGVDVTDAAFDDYCQISQDHAGDTFELTLLTDPATTVPVAPVTDFYSALWE